MREPYHEKIERDNFKLDYETGAQQVQPIAN